MEGFEQQTAAAPRQGARSLGEGHSNFAVSSRATDSTVTTTAVSQNLQGIHVAGGNLTVAAGGVHHHTHYHALGRNLPAALKRIPNFRKIHIDTLSKATPGTGVWIFRYDSFCLWLEPNGILKILWGSGIPGAGKTVLASIIINSLEARAKASMSPICVCYIYIRYSSKEDLTVRGVLEVFVKQTVERHPHCLAPFDEIYENHIREDTNPTEDELLHLLQRFTGTMAVTFYIIDALDEAPTGIQLDIMKKLASLDVKLFVTSRPSQALQEHFPRAHCFSITAQDQDIELHIAKEINRSIELCRILATDSTWRESVVESIKQKCSGMFLHASLQLDVLRECTSVRDVKDALEGFPAEIEDVYLQTWARILNQVPRKVLLAKTLLLWILHGGGSLTTTELQHFMALAPGTFVFDPDRLVPADTLIQLCRGLVTVDESSRLVRLVHYTARGVVNRLLFGAFPHPHSFFTLVCMAQITECKLREYWKRAGAFDLDPNPLFEYALEHWHTHARRALNENDPSSFNQIAQFIRHSQAFPMVIFGLPTMDLLRPLHLVAFLDLPTSLLGSCDVQYPNITTPLLGLTPICLASIRDSQGALRDLLSFPKILVNQACNDGCTPLIWAARCGNEDSVELLLSHPQLDAECMDTRGRSALIWACIGGYKDIARSLLSHCQTNINAVDNNGQTALMWASQNGHVGIVQLLLIYSTCQVNLKSNKGLTALAWASQGCQVGVVKTLLAHHLTDVNAVDNEGWSASLRASVNNHKDQKATIKLLLTHSRTGLAIIQQALIWALRCSYQDLVELCLSHPQLDVNLQDQDGRTPLMCASRLHRTTMVEMLLRHPAIDVNRIDDAGWTLLADAVYYSSAGVVELLLSHRQVEVNAADVTGQTGLICASRRCDEEKVRAFLAHPNSDVNLSDGLGLTALMWAAQDGSQSVVELLIAHPRIDINMSKEGWTALMWACRMGHEGVVRLFLAHSQITVTYSTLAAASAGGHEDIVQLLEEFRMHRLCECASVTEIEDLFALALAHSL